MTDLPADENAGVAADHVFDEGPEIGTIVEIGDTAALIGHAAGRAHVVAMHLNVRRPQPKLLRRLLLRLLLRLNQPLLPMPKPTKSRNG